MRMPAFITRFWPQHLAARLTLLVGFTATLSVTIAVSSMLFMGWQAAERNARAEAREMARSTAFSLEAPLAFQDTEGAREALSLLSRRPDVLAAWVRDADGRLLLTAGAASSVPANEGGSLRDGGIVVTERVRAGQGADLVGSVTLRIDLTDVREELRRQVLAAALASLVALALTVVLSRQMSRRMSVPVVRLAEAAAALTRDWSRRERLTVSGPGEIGVALDAYNHMVDELGRRDAALQALTDELRQAAAAADVARRQAESASVAKTRFLANMSHELRSPLNGVIGAAQLLEKADRDPAMRAELVGIIQTSGANLLDLIEGVLDVSRIEAGRVQTEQQPFDLIQCVEAALAPAVASAAVKGLQLDYHLDADVPAWCIGDASRVKQLLQNLLGNAVKFTDAGSVSLSVRRDAASNAIHFCVADTGVGIASHLLQSIFEPFQQGDPSATRRFGGSGLGLTICRDVARLMRGDVSVQSTPGEGSRFTLTLPLPAAAHAGSTPSLPRVRLRCFEPAPARRRSLAALLQRLGCRVEFFDCIDTVREALPRPAAGAHADIWLVAADAAYSDVVLQAARSAGPVRIVTLGQPDDPQGVDAVLGRPLTLSALRDLIAASDETAKTGTTADTLRRRLVRARVLLVEDDPVNRLVISAMIEGPEIQCIIASGGSEALQRLGNQRFDAVLMDWQMPDMDGLEVTRHLRAGICGELNRAVPVIALTANAFAEDRNACLAAGMNDFLTKPVQAQALLHCVQRWCRSIAAHSDPAQPVIEHRTLHEQKPAPDELPVYDPAVLAALPMGIDGGADDCIRELLELFATTARDTLRGMDAALGTRDWRGLQRQVHTLKSSAGQVGAMALSRLAAALEMRLRAGEAANATDLAQMRDAFTRFAAAALPAPATG